MKRLQNRKNERVKTMEGINTMPGVFAPADPEEIIRQYKLAGTGAAPGSEGNTYNGTNSVAGSVPNKSTPTVPPDNITTTVGMWLDI